MSSAAGTLLEYLILCLNTVCGRWLRAGWLILIGYALLQVLVPVIQIHRVPAYTSVFLWALLALALITGLAYRDRAFCRAFCPVAHLLRVYGRGGMLAVRPESADGCGDCAGKNCSASADRYKVDARSCPSLLNPAKLNDSTDCLICHGGSILGQSAKPHLSPKRSRRRRTVAPPTGPPADSIYADPVYLENAKRLITDRDRIVGGIATADYRDCVAIGSADDWCCTGTLVAPNVVVTAGHCYPECVQRVFVGDNVEQLEAGMLLYDAFYRWARDATDETHNWPAKPAAGSGRA